MLKIAPTGQQFRDVRARVLGYSDASLARTKEALADELGADASDMDAVLADNFQAERCTSCGHWFDKRDCCTDDRCGGFECAVCAAE